MNIHEFITDTLGETGGFAYALAVLMQMQHLTDEHGMTKEQAAERLGVTAEKIETLRTELAALVDV